MRPTPRLLALTALLALPLFARAGRGADDAGLAAALRPFVDRDVLAGAVVLVADRERTLALETVGAADRATHAPMRPDGLFWIASMNKPITAAALMILVDEGKVRLDAPVSDYLPAFRDQRLVVEASGDRIVLGKPGRPVRVRDLLSHTSGLVGKSPVEDRLDELSLREAAISYGLSPLKFEPGSKYEYCNPGINTVGRIIEAVSGIPYDRFLRERLLDPLGMSDTAFVPTEAQAARLAKSYKAGEGGSGLVETLILQLTYPLTDPKRTPYPGGGLFSTASDLARFGRMVLRGGELDGRRYLSEASVRAMTSTQTGTLLDPKGEAGYGLGWSTTRRSTGAIRPGSVLPGRAEHGGAHATKLTVDPATGLVTIYLVQHAGFPGNAGGAVERAFRDAANARFAHRTTATAPGDR